ncbi:MAG: orotidine 5'-phosphate decarboxylase, partial [Lachnospiraceae bacterium]|nr:orotidine 5'-phosphate decarboxylase [Lachnospiraceae bacterium]
MINKLISDIKKKNAPIVVGLDPTEKLIPDYIIAKHIREQGETLEAMGEAIWEYNKGLIDALYEYIPAVKPQIAMYERYGIPGLNAYLKTVKYCKE